eukprot:6235088-Prymnesium_polylepis.1
MEDACAEAEEEEERKRRAGSPRGRDGEAMGRLCSPCAYTYEARLRSIRARARAVYARVTSLQYQ